MVDGEAVGDADGEVVEDLALGFLVLPDEVVVQGVEESDLDQLGVGGAVDWAGWRVEDQRNAAW